MRFWSYLILVLLSFGCYTPALIGDFVFDDTEAIINNPDVDPSVTSWYEVFGNDFWGKSIESKSSHKSYRPFTVLWFRIDYLLADGRNPIVYHLINLILHSFVTILYVLVCKLVLQYSMTKDYQFEMTAFLAGMLFAVHPVHTECIAGIVGRAELASALCYFIALLCYIRACKNSNCTIIWFLITFVMSASAMLFKEQGITVLGVCIVYELFISTRIINESLLKCQSLLSIARILVLCMGCIVLLTLRFRIMITGPPTFQEMDNPASFSDSIVTKLLTYNYLYSLNAWILLNPFWLCFDWSMGCIPLITSFLDIRIFAIVVFWFILSCLVFYSLCFQKKEGRFLTICLALVIIPFLPATNIFFKVGFVIAERVLYLPSAGYCLLVAVGFNKLYSNLIMYRKATMIMMCFIIIVFTCRSFQRSLEWQTEAKLFISGNNVCNMNAKVHYNIGKIRTDEGSLTEAEHEYRVAIGLYPNYDQALNNLGNLLKETSRPFEAEEMFHRALNASPSFAAAWMNLGIVQAELKKFKDAENSYLNAIQHRKNYADAYYNLATLYIDIGRYEEAISYLSMTISFRRTHQQAWNNLGLLYQNMNDLSLAEGVFKEAISIFPNLSQFYFNLGVLLGKQGKYEEGKINILKAIKLNPNNANYYGNLGVVCHFNKEYNSAKYYYEVALKMDPQLRETQKNFEKLKQIMRNSKI